MKPRLYINQKITAFANRYRVYGCDENGKEGELVAFAQQKRLAFKEKVSFYSEEEKSQLSFTLRAEKVLDVHGRYFVEDESGQLVGMFKKDFQKSLLNSTWQILDKDGTALFIVKESSMTLAVIRRFAGWIPFVGEIVEFVTLFLRYHFVFIDVKNGAEVGKYQKITLIRDHYALSLTDEAYGLIDRRVFAAMGVALDALQSR